MNIHSLNGTWQLFKAGDPAPIPAHVPGCVHLDLLAASRIDDPFYRDNETRQTWIGETEWTYRRTFDIPREWLSRDHVRLRCHGLDTLATIRINDSVIARTDNMYRTYEYDIKPHLVPGENQIAITFAPPLAYLREKEAQQGALYAWGVGEHRVNSGAWLRKMPSNFGWDWGPRLVTGGIWRDIELLVYDTARLDDVLIRQVHDAGRVALIVALTARSNSAALSADVQVTLGGTAIAAAESLAFDRDRASVTLPIREPRLWWPNGMGDQPLYTVTVRLYDADHTVLDTVTKRIGLRTLALVRQHDRWGESFQFEANGTPFFVKGANWIPADTFPPRLARADYERLVAAAAAANMNMLRVWGGGLYESDTFYDLCDEYGICVWQDFIFACATYPTYDASFMANVQAEAEDNVRRIRHHASLALWCGNNELEQGLVGPEWTATQMSWDDYGKLFDDLLPGVIRRLDPDRDYWPGSPHSPHGDRNDWKNPAWGDVHIWDVWHAKQPFEHYRTSAHRFISEFGLQSFPGPRTTYSFTEPDDRNLTSYVMEFHQRSGIGNRVIMHYLLDWFRLPASFESLLWLSQILQGVAMKIAVEHWRRNMPRTMGTLYWQLNDCWPAPSWSSLDVAGRWKALHYMAKRFYAPLLLSAEENAGAGTVALHVTSDLAEPVPAAVTWMLTTIDGAPLARDEHHLTIPPRQNTPLDVLHLGRHLQEHGPRDLLLWIALNTQAGRAAEDVVMLARPKHLPLRDPAIRADVQPVDAHTAKLTLQAEHPALFVWLELPGQDVQFEDNFFHLRPGQPRTIVLSSDDVLTTDALRQELIVRSLIDTYR